MKENTSFAFYKYFTDFVQYRIDAVKMNCYNQYVVFETM